VEKGEDRVEWDERERHRHRVREREMEGPPTEEGHCSAQGCATLRETLLGQRRRHQSRDRLLLSVTEGFSIGNRITKTTSAHWKR